MVNCCLLQVEGRKEATFLRSGKRYFSQKYASSSVLLPPTPDNSGQLTANWNPSGLGTHRESRHFIHRHR